MRQGFIPPKILSGKFTFTKIYNILRSIFCCNWWGNFLIIFPMLLLRTQFEKKTAKVYRNLKVFQFFLLVGMNLQENDGRVSSPVFWNSMDLSPQIQQTKIVNNCFFLNTSNLFKENSPKFIR